MVGIETQDRKSQNWVLIAVRQETNMCFNLFTFILLSNFNTTKIVKKYIYRKSQNRISSTDSSLHIGTKKRVELTTQGFSKILWYEGEHTYGQRLGGWRVPTWSDSKTRRWPTTRRDHRLASEQKEEGHVAGALRVAMCEAKEMRRQKKLRSWN